MKSLLFLFENFNLFLIVYAVVLLDAVVTIVQAGLDRELNWGAIPGYLKKIVNYTAFLIMGNLVGYVSQRTGHSFEMLGFMTAFLTIMTAEVGSLSAKILPKKTGA